MKESPLHKAFEDAMRKRAKDTALLNCAQQLGVMRSVAIEFQEADMPVTLTVRPGREGASFADAEDDNEMLANGAITIGDAAINFLIEKDQYDDDRMFLKMFRGDRSVMDRTFYYDDGKKKWQDETEEEDSDGGWDDDDEEDNKEEKPQDFRAALCSLLIDVKAEYDFVSRFSVGPEGVRNVAVEKPFKALPQLKLKGDPKP